MFESVQETWKRYAVRLADVLPPGDPRLMRSVEVDTRIGQLDLLVRHARDSLDRASGTGGGHRRQETLEAWDAVSLFTDGFYFFAWRLIDVWNAQDGGAFPGLAPLVAEEVVGVRQSLLERPEATREYYRHALHLRDELTAALGDALGSPGSP